MSVRAKFKVDSITRTKHWDKSKGEIQTIKLSPVSSGSQENTSFYAATPSGQISLDTLNEEAGRQFELGVEYYIDFTKAE
jgi:hypothetical protein